MIEDAGAAQARLLLKALHQQVFDISQKLEIAERRGVRTSARGGLRDRRDRSELRRDLYEVHRLIQGLHRRFPATADSWPGLNTLSGTRPLILVGQNGQDFN